MPISEQQLSQWSQIGDQAGSERTYRLIRSALDDHSWPSAMNHNVYLQGSYANHTNIVHDSDVDIIVETSNSFFSNVPSNLQSQHPYNFRDADYEFDDFRSQVFLALHNRFGNLVSIGDKSIKVGEDGVRLNADVVPCSEYRKYVDGRLRARGIKFVTRSGVSIVNFPRSHKENGESKNARCHARYKPAIRMFKNARNAAGSKFPSYFLECLLYNVPDSLFSSVHSSTYVSTLNHLGSVDVSSLLCQNQEQMIIGSRPWQISLAEVNAVLRSLRLIW